MSTHELVSEFFTHGISFEKITGVFAGALSRTLGDLDSIMSGLNLNVDGSVTAAHGPDASAAVNDTDAASARGSSVQEKAEPYYGPGRDPVGRPSADGKTAIENAYEGSNPAMDVEKDMSPMMQSARAVADKAGMAVGSPERIAFLNAVQDRTGLTDGVLKDGDRVIMGDGPGGGASKAKLMVIDGGARGVNDAALPVERGTYTWTDAEGNKHSRSFSIIKDCANPTLDEKGTVAPAEVVPEAVPQKPAVSYRVDPYYMDNCSDQKLHTMLLADIHVPAGIEPGTAEYDAFIAKAVAEIQLVQGTMPDGFVNYNGVRIMDANDNVLKVQCLKDGKLGTWDIYINGKDVGDVSAKNYDAFVTGALDKGGDGHIASPLDAKVTYGEDGKPQLKLFWESKKDWTGNQMSLMAQDVFTGEKDSTLDDLTLEQQEVYNKVLNTRIPDGFFEMNEAQRIRTLKELGLTSDQASDLNAYLSEYYQHGGMGQNGVHLPNEVKSAPGQTFGSFLKRGAEGSYDALRARFGLS